MFSTRTPVTGGYCAFTFGANGIPKPPTVTGVFFIQPTMKQDYKGFTVPEKIWRSDALDMNAKFVACCLIDHFERLGVNTRNRLPEYECEINIEQMNDILDRSNISLHIFFGGLNCLGEHGFISKLIVSCDGIVTIKTHF
jgi:hypothetical protein